MAWYYVLNGSSQGPVEAAELQNLRQQNVITAATPVWTQGMAEWAPFEQTALLAPTTAAGEIPRPPWAPPPAASTVAAAYATDALSYTWAAPPNAVRTAASSPRTTRKQMLPGTAS